MNGKSPISQHKSTGEHIHRGNTGVKTNSNWALALLMRPSGKRLITLCKSITMLCGTGNYDMIGENRQLVTDEPVKFEK